MRKATLGQRLSRAFDRGLSGGAVSPAGWLAPCPPAVVLTAAAVILLAGLAPASARAQAERPADLNPLTGTYRERESKDEEIGRKILAVTARLEREEREKFAKEFFKVLSAEPLFAIEQYDTTVTVNYPTGRRVPFEADGKVRRFRVRGAGLLNLRAWLEGQRLTVDFAWPEGDRLRLTYEKSADGRQLTFTRSAASRAVPVPITVSSQYELVSPRATRSFAGLAPR